MVKPDTKKRVERFFKLSNEGIESFLGLSNDEILKQKMEEVEKTIRTNPAGINYLVSRLQDFRAPQWKFLIHLAYNRPEKLDSSLSAYAIDNEGDYYAIKDKILEYYVLLRVYDKMTYKAK